MLLFARFILLITRYLSDVRVGQQHRQEGVEVAQIPIGKIERMLGLLNNLNQIHV